MYIDKIFSNYEDNENLYSVIMNEDELRNFSKTISSVDYMGGYMGENGLGYHHSNVGQGNKELEQLLVKSYKFRKDPTDLAKWDPKTREFYFNNFEVDDNKKKFKGEIFEGESKGLADYLKDKKLDPKNPPKAWSYHYSADNKSAREAYRELLRADEAGYLNKHYKLSKEAKKAIKDSIRRAERKAKIAKIAKVGGFGALGLGAAGLGAKYLYDKNSGEYTN